MPVIKLEEFLANEAEPFLRKALGELTREELMDFAVLNSLLVTATGVSLHIPLIISQLSEADSARMLDIVTNTIRRAAEMSKARN
jgi:hypothetical protein